MDGAFAETTDYMTVHDEFRSVVTKRIKCNKGCRYFDICPWRVFSKDDGQCHARDAPITAVRIFINLLVDGQYGVEAEILNATFEYALHVKENPTIKNRREYIDTLIKVHKELYGSTDITKAPSKLVVGITESNGYAYKDNDQLSDIDAIPEDDAEDEESLFFDGE